MKQVLGIIGGFALIVGLGLWLDRRPEPQPDIINVKVTMYTTDPKQTDATPYITASGFRLNKRNPKRHRIIAVSRDIKEKLNFGDTVVLEGTGKWDGEYIVHDLMNRRWKNRIDILVNPKDKTTMFAQAKLIIP